MERGDELEEIKKLIRGEGLIIGTRNTIKKLKAGRLEKIWLSSNVPRGIKEDITRYAGISGAGLAELGIPNDELGVFCKKRFAVSVVSKLKGEK